MVVVPADTAVTTPVLEIVATAVFEEVQGVVASAVAEPVSAEVLPIQALSVPEIVGRAFTVKVAICVQPFAFL